MGNSFRGGEGRRSWEREDKRGPKLRSLADPGSANFSFPEAVKAPEDESGSKSPEPISTLPDYSGNENKDPERAAMPAPPEVLQKPFDPTDYRTYAKNSFSLIKNSVRSLENDVKKYLNEDEQKRFLELVERYKLLNRQNPGSWREANEMTEQIDDLRGKLSGLHDRVDTEKDFAQAPPEPESIEDASFEAADEVESPRTDIAVDIAPAEADEVIHNNPVNGEKYSSGYASAKMVEYPYNTGTEKIENPQVTFSMSGNEVSFANETNIEKKLEDIKKSAEIRSEVEVPNYTYKTEAVEDPLAGIDAKLFESALNEELQKEQAAFNNSVSVLKLREKNPSMTDEQINAELERRHRNYREFLQLRGELKEGFLPYYEAKNKYRETYKNQLSGGYTIYKRTNWLSKMFGFNPKNLNALAAAERNEFAGTRVAYRDKLEGLLNNKLVNSPEFTELVVARKTKTILNAQNMIKAAMTDRFLLRPARETLKLQNEIFPETDRKNIINKFKAVIKAHPRLAMGVGATAAISTVATGGLAAIIPMTFGAGGAAIARILSTKFGVNKSERALDSVLKNATLGLTADDIVAAEMKLITAHQDVEISKNRRDVYTTLGGVAGGLVGGSVYGYMNSGSEVMVPGPAEVTPPATESPIVAPEPHIEAPDVVTPEPVAPEAPLGPDMPAAPETPTPPESGTEAPPAPEPAPEGEPELEDEGEGEEEEIYPPGQEPQNIYEVQPGDNFWNIMEGQTAAPQPPTMDWIEQNQPEHYQELIKLVENYANADSELRSMLGFEGTMDDLQIGSEVNLDLLDYLARSIAEDRGWIDHVEIDMPQVSPEMEEIINTKVKTIMV